MNITNQPQQDEQQPDSPLAPTPDAAHDGGTPPPPFTGEELLQQQQPGPANLLPWWVWALALLIVIPATALFVWRARTSTGPSVFSADLPLLLYERLQGWTQRLGLGHSAAQTPYEHARQVTSALPETEPYITPITGEYVRYRFARQAQSGGPAPALGSTVAGSTVATNPELLGSWKLLEPLFWKAWWRKQRERIFKPRQKDVYTLIDPEERK